MCRFQIALVASVLAVGGPAMAKDRPVTEEERAKLVAALSAEGCSGGKMKFDDDDAQFEVEAARCGDGRKYEFEFDKSFKLIKKKLED